MKVAILVFPGVEELDFVGFLEALAVANRLQEEGYFETELVGTEAGPIECSGGLKVVPDRILRDLRGQDLLFVPGGGARRGTGVDALLENRLVLDALRKAHEEGKMVWSVCTGALLLARAGLLEGRAATTHHEFFDDLKRSGARIRRARVVVDGRITTGGGISSSIDVGLELVKKTLGREVAKEVGERMEYPPLRR
ncbi:MAG: DJ-1/PfpI family protein [Nitrososphaerales archaeon]|jgi:cyclohexyl-isocyanide hydratase